MGIDHLLQGEKVFYINLHVILIVWCYLLTIHHLNYQNIVTYVENILSREIYYREAMNCSRALAAKKNIHSTFIHKKKYIFGIDSDLRLGYQILMNRVKQLEDEFCHANGYFEAFIYFQKNHKIGFDGANWVGSVRFLGESK